MGYSKTVLESVIKKVSDTLKPDSSALTFNSKELGQHFFLVGVPKDKEAPRLLGLFEALIGYKQSTESYQERILTALDNLTKGEVTQLDLIRLLVNDFINDNSVHHTEQELKITKRTLWALQKWVTNKNDLEYYLDSNLIKFEKEHLSSGKELIVSIIEMINLDQPSELFEIFYDTTSLARQSKEEISDYDQFLYEILDGVFVNYFGKDYRIEVAHLIRKSLREFCASPGKFPVGLPLISFLDLSSEDLDKFFKNYEAKKDITASLASIAFRGTK